MSYDHSLCLHCRKFYTIIITGHYVQAVVPDHWESRQIPSHHLWLLLHPLTHRWSHHAALSVQCPKSPESTHFYPSSMALLHLIFFSIFLGNQLPLLLILAWSMNLIPTESRPWRMILKSPLNTVISFCNIYPMGLFMLPHEIWTIGCNCPVTCK